MESTRTAGYVRQLIAALLLSATINDASGYRVKRIAGGEEAETEDFPYQVSLRYEGLHVCGGALVSRTHVLSAAHCVCGLFDEPYDELTVVTGTNSIHSGGQVNAVADVRCHPRYKFGLQSSWVNDLVLITLNASVTINRLQSPIALASADIGEDARAVITGWGRSDPRGYLHKKLQKLSVRVLNNGDCQKRHNVSVLPSQLCTYSGKGSGACMGDSGGPLVSGGKLVGIFSWTKPCALGSPDVFSRIPHFVDFIESAMKTNETNDVASKNSIPDVSQRLVDEVADLINVSMHIGVTNSTREAAGYHTNDLVLEDQRTPTVSLV